MQSAPIQEITDPFSGYDFCPPDAKKHETLCRNDTASMYWVLFAMLLLDEMFSGQCRNQLIP